MIYDYEYFKKEIYSLTTIDLNAYKEKQMKRRIDTLPNAHHSRCGRFGQNFYCPTPHRLFAVCFSE